MTTTVKPVIATRRPKYWERQQSKWAGVTGHKRCSRCRQRKPVTEYNIDRRRKDGFQNICQRCASFEAKMDYNAKRDQRQAKLFAGIGRDAVAEAAA